MAKKSKKVQQEPSEQSSEQEEVMSDLPSEVSDEGGQQLGYDMEEGEFDMDDELVGGDDAGSESGEMEEFDGGSEEAIEAA